ncbi:hypothetical protein C8J56DRAFT_901579 [Mycena floridula]|nr:hypothetical protein C8J56DRAFT_901579 [Mycena floridula]
MELDSINIRNNPWPAAGRKNYKLKVAQWTVVTSGFAEIVGRAGFPSGGRYMLGEHSRPVNHLSVVLQQLSVDGLLGRGKSSNVDCILSKQPMRVVRAIFNESWKSNHLHKLSVDPWVPQKSVSKGFLMMKPVGLTSTTTRGKQETQAKAAQWTIVDGFAGIGDRWIVCWTRQSRLTWTIWRENSLRNRSEPITNVKEKTRHLHNYHRISWCKDFLLMKLVELTSTKTFGGQERQAKVAQWTIVGGFARIVDRENGLRNHLEPIANAKEKTRHLHNCKRGKSKVAQWTIVGGFQKLSVDGLVLDKVIYLGLYSQNTAYGVFREILNEGQKSEYLHKCSTVQIPWNIGLVNRKALLLVASPPADIPRANLGLYPVKVTSGTNLDVKAARTHLKPLVVVVDVNDEKVESRDRRSN